MRLDKISRTQWVLAGISLRVVLLGWGAYQDATSAIPYTDIDYKVFTSATRHLVSSCPLDEIIDVPSQEDYADLVDPPQARGSCAQGIIPAASRFILQAQPELEQLEIESQQYAARGGRNRRPYQEPERLSKTEMIEKLTMLSFSILNPIFRFFASLGNPYKRDTYRYTPLLAVLLAPGEMLSEKLNLESFSAFYGKLVFVLADILVALLIWDIVDVRRSSNTTTTQKDATRGNDSWHAGLLWLVNPFTAQISTRGSSESVLGVLILGFLSATLRSYPEATSVKASTARNGHATATKETQEEASNRNAEDDAESIDGEMVKTDEEEEETDSTWNNAALMAPFLLALSIHWKLYPVIYAVPLVPHLIKAESVRAVFRFGGIAVYSLIGISAPVFAIWGWPYIHETLLYHLTRSDHRHNFSPFFLVSYLTSSSSSAAVLSSNDDAVLLLSPLLTTLQPFLAFVPQLGLSAYLGFSIGGQDLVAAMTFQTIAFVAFNKVCTSQYYMWIMWFLPIVAPTLRFPGGLKDVVTLVGVWVAAQAVWLSQAYLLEFKAQDTFVRVWLASLFLLFTHVFLLVRLVKAWGDHQRLSPVSPAAVEKKTQ